VNLLELTSAYAPFANGGMGVIPNVITRIEGKDGKVLYEASNAGPGRVVAPNVLAEMNDMLSTAVEVGTGKGANLNGWQFGGKTGTSQEAKDAVFVGYTAAMVTGVWLGNDDSTSTSLSGGNVPAAIWSQFMTKAHQGKQIQQIPGGSYDTQYTAQPVIDPATGQVVIDPNTGQPMTQYIDNATGQPVPGQQPIQTGAMVDPATGLPVENSTAPFAMQIDPNTGMPVGQVVQDQAIDPVTGFPLQPQNNGLGSNAPIDPDTGLPMTLVIDPALSKNTSIEGR
jgi:penicillin-binding protein 1A